VWSRSLCLAAVVLLLLQPCTKKQLRHTAVTRLPQLSPLALITLLQCSCANAKLTTLQHHLTLPLCHATASCTTADTTAFFAETL
jgi:hypothetical protein